MQSGGVYRYVSRCDQCRYACRLGKLDHVMLCADLHARKRRHVVNVLRSGLGGPEEFYHRFDRLT